MRRYLLLTGGEGDPLKIETEDHSEGIVFRVSGEVDLANISRLKTALQPVLTKSCNVILDVSDLRYLDSTGLHVLFDANKVLRQHSCQMIVVGPRPGIAKVFSIVHLDKSIPVVTSTDEAMALLRTNASAAASDG